jgi:hypothetical protein
MPPIGLDVMADDFTIYALGLIQYTCFGEYPDGSVLPTPDLSSEIEKLTPGVDPRRDTWG